MSEAHELVPFLAVHAARYAEDHGLDGLHPTHYDLIKKYGGRMDSFKRATNAPKTNASSVSACETEGGEK